MTRPRPNASSIPEQYTPVAAGVLAGQTLAVIFGPLRVEPYDQGVA